MCDLIRHLSPAISLLILWQEKNVVAKEKAPKEKSPPKVPPPPLPPFTVSLLCLCLYLAGNWEREAARQGMILPFLSLLFLSLFFLLLTFACVPFSPPQIPQQLLGAKEKVPLSLLFVLFFPLRVIISFSIIRLQSQFILSAHISLFAFILFDCNPSPSFLFLMFHIVLPLFSHHTSLALRTNIVLRFIAFIDYWYSRSLLPLWIGPVAVARYEWGGDWRDCDIHSNGVCRAPKRKVLSPTNKKTAPRYLPSPPLPFVYLVPASIASKFLYTFLLVMSPLHTMCRMRFSSWRTCQLWMRLWQSLLQALQCPSL